MAERAFKVIDRRNTDSGHNRFTANLYGFQDAASTAYTREKFQLADRDSQALVASWDRIKLLTVGRHLYARDPIIQGSLDQVSRLTTAIVTPQFDGEDTEWGNTAEDWLYENDRWIDVRGPGAGVTMNDQDRLIVLHILQDGDIGEILTEDESGNPKTQLIPAHRIACRNFASGRQRIEEGKFKGNYIIDGVIVGESMEVLGYRVLGDKPESDRDFSVNDMRLHFVSRYADQIRGFSHLASAAIGIQDVHEARRLELIAQKKMAATVLIEHNETGAPSQEASIIIDGQEPSSANGNVSVNPVYGEAMNGGETQYFRAGSQSKLEVLSGDRPTVNQREFSAELVRQAIHGIGWSVDYALDPTKAGGAQMRIVVENCNRTLDFLRKIVEKRRKWVDGWRIAKAIKAGWLKASNDWWRWEYQFAARLTADKKYDSEVDINEMVSGVSTQADACARRGLWWEDVNKAKAREVRDKLTKAKELASEFGLTIQEVIPHMGMLHPMELLASTSRNQGGNQDSNPDQSK